jgi:hypothetical protein
VHVVTIVPRFSSCPTGTPGGKGDVTGIWNKYRAYTLGEIIIVPIILKLNRP